MDRAKVAIVRYRSPFDSIKEAVNLCDGFSRAGIDLKGGLLEELEKGVEGSMSRYEGRDEFLEGFYRVGTE